MEVVDFFRINSLKIESKFFFPLLRKFLKEERTRKEE